MAKKSEINKKDLINLIEITDEEFARITDNLYSQKIDYKSLPNLVLLPTVKEELRKELNIKGNLYITKNRLLHTNPVRKNAHKNQGFTKEEYSSIPETIRNATYVLKETESEYNSFLITALDKNDSCKVNCIIFDEDKNGNLLTTIKKIPLLSLRSRIYKIVGTGVEPAISNALCEPSTTLTTSPNNENNTTKDEFVNNLAVDTTIINQDSSKSNNSEKIAPQEIAERAQFVQNKLSEAGIDVVSDKNEFDTIISKEADGKIFKLQPITEYGKNDFYRKIAGEVEARNVQNRMNMTPEERLNTPLSETEDVAQEDQIVTFDGTVAASKITSRSQYLEGKTSLTDEDIISLLDLPPEKESRKDLKSYTDKNYSDFENDEASLQRLTENLINNSDYLLYRGSYVAKSKLLYEQSVTLCNEIPTLVIGQEIKESFYLLPYGYAKDSKQNFKQFADILDKTVFTDIKRIYGESLRNNFKKAHKQGKNVFFFICNDKLDSKECENEIKKCVYNRKEIKDKSAKYYFYIEKSKQCLIFDFDSKGKLLKKKKLNIDLKKIKLSTNEELKVVRGRMQSIPSGTLKNLSDNKESVNTFFNSLLLRGEVEMIRRHKELQKYDLKYLNCLEALKQITNHTQSELLQNSNRLFIQSEIESEFYKDLIKEKKRNVALIDKTQGDKSMPSEKKELNISEEEAVRIQLAREIRQNMPNLSDGERAAALAILEAGAASMKMTLRDYVQTTFPHGVFGDFDKAQNAAQQQGVEINGAVSVSGFGANARAVIYASKTADFSTWCHELSHIWQVQLTGELKVNAEKVFQVQNGNWQESTYTFADGHTDTSAEAFAYGFEDFLKHKAGEMAAEDKKAIFEKFADYMSRTYNGVKENIKVNEDIAKVYEQFVQLDDNILAEAEKAVRMEKDLYDSKKNINALLNSPDLRSSKKVSKTLGYVSPQFSRLAKQYGYDIEGFRHTIDNFFINHANNRHSTARTETARGNVAITNDDILNIAKVYESPDYIIFGTKTKTGNPAIVYAKNMGNATVFVEDVRSGKKELAAETLYKKSGAIDVSSKKEAPELYAHSDPESISIVDVKKEFVNHIANGELIFQAAYHGSGASFDHFDTEHYGLSGEGSMSFGWGTYLTESEAIARDYADRQNGIGKKLDSLLKKYPDLYSHITPIYNHMSLGDSFEEAKKNYVGYLRENHIPGIRKITKSIEELKAEDFAELFKKDRNLYTVSIPDGKYLSWNNDVPEATKTEIAEKLHSHLVESDPESYSGNAANYLRQELESLFESEMDGQRFYGSLADYLGSERQASEFLKESGYTGISYPAGTIYGNGNGATNYVIFNDDDIEIKEHLQFQTRTTEQKERKKIEVQTYKFQNGETIDEILSKQTSWATDEEFLDNMIDNSLHEVADFADEKENELLKKISIAKNNTEVDLKLLAVQTDAAARYMAEKHYDYRLADVGKRPFSKDFINLYAQDDFPYELPSWMRNHLEEYPNQNVSEHTSEEEKAYQEWEEMLDDNQREENDSNGQLSKFDSELSEYIAGKLPKNHIFELGFPGEILQNCGFPKEQRIELSGSHLEFKSKLKRHPFDLGEIKGLDVALQNPVAVFAYGDKTKSQNVIVNIEKEGKNFLTGIHFNQKNRGYEVSDIRTLYPKENIEWLNWINQGKMIYGNKEKLQALIAQQRMNVAEVNSQVVQSPLHEHCLESVKNILQKFGDVKEIYTDGHLFYEEIREQSKIEQKFFAYYTEKGNIDARELSSLEAEEFYNALKHNDITKIDEYKNNDFHEISELADEIYLEHFKNSVSTEEKYVIESLSEIGNAIKNDSAIILKSPTFGDVTFSKGVFGDLSKKNNGGYGINHIVEGRYVKDNLSKQDIASLLYLIKNTVETTEVDKDDSKSRQNIIKDGIWVTIRKDFDGIKQNWVVTGFAENDGNGQITKEAADAIKAVNAQYGYAPEHLFVSEQVGAVIASVNTIAQNILKSNDIERIKNFKSVYANTEFLSENEKGLFIDNQSQLMSRGKQEKSLDSETTIPQNTENSINYHGLTLTNMAAKHYDDYFAEYAPKEDLLNVINFSNWTYFNSEKISTKVYDVEISASLYEQLLPSEYKERSIKEDEVVCIQYRKSVLSEEQDQFLIEKFDKNNFMLLQQKEIQIDVELKNKIKSICNSYIEPQNNNSYTDEILDKIRAAGIEVVTDKDEFDRIATEKTNGRPDIALNQLYHDKFDEYKTKREELAKINDEDIVMQHKSLEDEWISKKGNIDVNIYERERAILNSEIESRNITGGDYWKIVEEQNSNLKTLNDYAEALKNNSQLIFKNPDLGKIVFDNGFFGNPDKDFKGGYGIKHLIASRSQKDNMSIDAISALLLKVKDVVESVKPEDPSKDHMNLIKDGIWVGISKQWSGTDETWIITGFPEKENANSFTKEATDTIQTVIARNSYALEHSSIREQVGAVIESIALDNEKSTIKNNNEKSKERHSDAKDYLIQTTRLFLSKLKEKNLPFLKGKEQGSIIIIKPQVVRDAATGKAFTGYTQLMAQALIQALYDQKKLPELEYDLITYDQAKACGTFIKKGSPHITLTNYNRTTNSASKQMYYFKSGCNSPEMIDLHKESIARNRAIKRIRLSLEEKEIPSERQTEEKNKITLLHYEEMTYLKALNKDTEQYFDSLLAEEKNMLTELCKKTPLTQKNVKELAETLRKDRLISTQLSLQKNSERYFDATECIVPEDFIAKAMAAASLGCSLETTEKTIDSITKDLHQTLSKNIDHYDYGKAFEVGEVITEKCIKNCKEMKNQEYEAAELAKKLEQKQQELKKNPINLLMELLNKNDLSNRTIGGYER